MSEYLREKARLKAKYKSTMHYVLTSLVPYSEANLKLGFKPNLFFNDLEKLDSIKRETAKSAYYRAIKHGYVKVNDSKIPKISNKGWRKLKAYTPRELKQGARLVVTFDIPESDRDKRNQLRTLLRELKFKQVQLSVWQSEYDGLKYLKEEIERIGIRDKVKIYEAIPV